MIGNNSVPAPWLDGRTDAPAYQSRVNGAWRTAERLSRVRAISANSPPRGELMSPGRRASCSQFNGKWFTPQITGANWHNCTLFLYHSHLTVNLLMAAEMEMTAGESRGPIAGNRLVMHHAGHYFLSPPLSKWCWKVVLLPYKSME